MRGPWVVLRFSVSIAVLALLSIVEPVRADRVTDAADQVLAAFQAKDANALKALAQSDEPDPWLVADKLCLRGKHDAADAFAKAAPRKDTEKLPAYVTTRRAGTPNGKARRALGVAQRAARAGDAKVALAALDEAGASAAGVLSVRVRFGRGGVLRSLRRLDESAKAYLAAADVAERIGWLARAALAFHKAGMSAYYGSDMRGVLAAWGGRLRIEKWRGNRRGVARSLGNIGNIYVRLGNPAKALDHQQRALKIHEDTKNRAGVAVILGNIGQVHEQRGDYAKALDYQQRALKVKKALGDRTGVAGNLGVIGNIYSSLGDYAKAHDYLQRALKVNEELGDRFAVALTRGNIGLLYERLGEYAKALDYHQRALKAKEELGDRAGTAATLINIGNVHVRLGAHAKALDFYERGLKQAREIGHRQWASNALMGIGAVQQRLGDFTKALDYYGRALKTNKELGDRAGMATTLGNIGAVHSSLGDHAKALDYHGRSLELSDKLGHRAGVALALHNIGLVHSDLGNYARALLYYGRSLKMWKELGNRASLALALVNVGIMHEELGDYATAREFKQRALALAIEVGALTIEVEGHFGIAALYYKQGQLAEAARSARRGVEKLPLLVGRLAEEQGAKAREYWARLFDVGVAAGRELEDAATVSYFMESGRAGALLESLGGREALGRLAIPEELRRDESAARAGVLAARARHARALKTGELKKIRATRSALEAAHAKVLEVVSRIQRDAKATADVKYPQAAELKEIQTSLAEGEALVEYALLPTHAVALVVTAENARIVPLGKTKDVQAACAALKAKDKSRDPAAAIRALQEHVVAPLGLDKGARRLLVSPHGLLASVPFALLFENREVVMVPSGTTYGVLLDERLKRGEQVLALGDPDYGAKADRRALGVMRAGGRLVPLPGTRAEAKAVGDVFLLGGNASETEFRKVVAGAKRWRAVHLACHGLIRTDQPQLSSLALTPSAEDDGFLTVLEVFRMAIPADLVVLSACETGRGKRYQAEGIVGFTRAFMLAGAPRVIVSLWKVDDEATRALMVKFYGLWKPGKLATATALKQAQEFVKSHPKWSHPYYWAAWQLWGLGD